MPRLHHLVMRNRKGYKNPETNDKQFRIGFAEKGIIRLIPIPNTRNKKNIELTESGREFAEKTVGRLYDAELDALSTLTDDEREQYIRLNQKYNEKLAEKIEEITDDFT